MEMRKTWVLILLGFDTPFLSVLVVKFEVDISLAGRVILNHGWARIDTDKKKWGKGVFFKRLFNFLVLWSRKLGGFSEISKAFWLY